MIIKKISETVWKETHWSNIKSGTRIKLTTGTEDETVVEGVADWQSLNFLHINNPDSLGAIVILNISYPKLLDTYTFYVRSEKQRTVIELEDGDYIDNVIVRDRNGKCSLELKADRVFGLMPMSELYNKAKTAGIL